MKISEIVRLIMGYECSTLAIDIGTIILFLIYSIILAMPFYIILSILKYKRKK